MDVKQRTISIDEKIKVVKLKVKVGTMIYDGRVLLIYVPLCDGDSSVGQEQKKLKSPEVGVVRRILIKEGDVVSPGSPIIELEKKCNHPTVIKDLCAECGADLQKENEEGGQVSQASVSMVHMVPELKVNQELAQMLGKADMDRLLEQKKLVLLVDLDQTLIHTTNDNIPNNIKDVYHFQLYGSRSPWYHTRLRPGTHNFLQGISEKYELHICTFGSRRYAHMIAKFLDPEGKFFSHRILSRDECFNPNSKTANLKALFPCGENMVCIIDDREDVWDYASNLIHVKPYHFFQHTGDIHAPPGLTKCENDDNTQGFDFSKFDSAIGEENTDDVGDVSIEGEATDENEMNVDDGDSKLDAESDEKVIGSTSESRTQTSKEGVTDSGDDGATKPVCDTTDGAIKSVCDTTESGTETAKNEITDFEVDSATGTVHVEVSTVNDTVIPKLIADSEEFKPTADTNESKLTADTKESSKENGSEEGADDLANSTATNGNEVESRPAAPEQEATPNDTGVLASLEQTSAAKESDLVPSVRPAEPAECVDSANPPSNNEPVHQTESKVDADGFITIEESDDYLLYLEEILKIIHAEFFKRLEETGEIPDLKTVVPETRATVLRGVSIVFSGIVPNRIKLEDSPAYKIARSLGAKVTQNIETNTTHLVALRAGTAKVHAAYKRKNLKLVTPEWLWTCAERWEKVDERLFPLKNAKPNTESRNPPAHCRSPDHPEPLPFTYQVNAPSSPPPPVGGFLYSINPLMSLSSEDIETMEGEVEDIFKESDGEADVDEILQPDEGDTEENGDGDTVCRKRKLDNDSSSSSESDDTREKKYQTYSTSKKRKRQEEEFNVDLDDYILNYAGDAKDEDDDENDKEDDSDDETINEKFRRGMGLPHLDMDYNTEEGTEEDVESDGEWNVMGAALEREFLGE